MPRWVKVFVAVAVVAVVVLVVSLLAGVDHGPGQHAPPEDDHAPPGQHGP